MTEEVFNFILQTGTYNGDVCYNNYEEMEPDYKSIKAVSLNPAEIKRIVFTAYQFGKLEGDKRKMKVDVCGIPSTKNLYAVCKMNYIEQVFE